MTKKDKALFHIKGNRHFLLHPLQLPLMPPSCFNEEYNCVQQTYLMGEFKGNPFGDFGIQLILDKIP